MKQDIITAWKTLADNKQNTARHHIQLCILRAMASKGEDKVAIAKHLLRKAFSPITNVNELANGATPFQAISAWSNHARISTPKMQSVAEKYNFAVKDREYGDLLGVPANTLLTDEEIDLYESIYKEVSPQTLVRRYSYFFGRQDYFEEYQTVQIAHAALELGSKLSPEQVKDLHFTVCGVEDLAALEDVERVLDAMKVPYVTFREPDIGNQKTAIGVYPLEEHRRGLLRNYNLLRFTRDSLRQIVDEMIATQEEVV